MFSEEGLRAPGFSWSSMLSLALASKYSYEDAPTFASVVADNWDVQITAAADVEDTQGYVLESDQVAVVVYRGTESIADWLTNFKVFDTEGALGEVHLGFFDSYQRTKDIILPRVLEASSAGKAIWFCGHSLGGAIATIAAIETSSQISMTGLATFGQPRTARRSASSKIEAEIGDRYFRFVNDDDVVPRVPILFGHTGQLLHFDGYGELQEDALESEGQEGEVNPPLTEEELTRLRMEITQVRSSLESASGIETTLEGSVDDQLDVTVEGLIPSVFDHSMEKYVTAIRRFAVSPFESASIEIESITSMYETVLAQPSVILPEFESFNPDLSLDEPDIDSSSFGDEDEAADESGAEFEIPAQSPDPAPPITNSTTEQQPQQTMFPLLLELAVRDWRPPAGVKINSHYQRIATTLVTAEQMKLLGADRDVSIIEVSRDAGMLELDQSVPFVNGNAVQAPAVDEKGDSAIVGVIDTGIDVLHDAFMNADNSGTRVLGIWDQRNPAGPTPKEVDSNKFSQDYGTLHLKSELDERIAKHRSGETNLPFSLRDKSRHGTNVSSIAAGRATANLSSGMAPEASILLVAPNLSQEPGAPRSIGYSSSHVDALAFLTTAAAGNNAVVQEQMPIAINVSLGMNAGAHDGSTLLEAAFDSATNIGRDPGVVIVKSAGNERNHKGHASVMAALGGIVTIEWESKDKFRHEDYFEAWFGELDDLSFRVVDPQGNQSEEVSFENPRTNANLGGNACSLSLTRGYRDNGANRFALRIAPQAKQIQPERWVLEIVGRKIGATDQGRVNMWVERSRFRAVSFIAEDERMTLSVPGTAETVITVGACNSETPWRINASSSYGPTRKNTLKPDICAPGFEVKAALASETNTDATMAMSGTSMAAPHVTGALALVLSRIAKQPGARLPNAKQLGAAVRRTVKGGAVAHHPGAGFGVLDAEALFIAMQEHLG